MVEAIIDRRENQSGRSLPDRQRLLQRERHAVRKAVQRKIAESGIKEITDGFAKKITVKPTHGTKEPTFHHKRSGSIERVLPGNKKFNPGDTISRPDGGDGGGREGSDSGDGEDDFIFELSEEEYLEYLFDGLKLPNFVKKALTGSDVFVSKRAGFAADGPPNQLDLVRSMRGSIMRRKAFNAPRQKKKRELEEEQEYLIKNISEAEQSGDDCSAEKERLEEIEKELEIVKRRLGAIPFLDESDLRYRRFDQENVPISKAVMFCLMDTSASMGEREKDLAKRFFVLIKLFLSRYYDHCEVVFIRHTHEAQEVDEETFFFGRESGGTVVSTALVEMSKIIKERYPVDQWNIYGCQASDGENYSGDSEKCQTILEEHLLPLCQYFAYIEILEEKELQGLSENDGEDLWQYYRLADVSFPNFVMKRVALLEHIYPVFRELFSVEGDKK